MQINLKEITIDCDLAEIHKLFPKLETDKTLQTFTDFNAPYDSGN